MSVQSMIVKMSTCPFTLGKPEDPIEVNKYHIFTKSYLIEWIHQAGLGINLDNASVDEWVMTAHTEEKYQGSYRLVNPFTNTRFTEKELTKIYYFLSISDENVGVTTRSKV